MELECVFGHEADQIQKVESLSKASIELLFNKNLIDYEFTKVRSQNLSAYYCCSLDLQTEATVSDSHF